MIPEENQKKMIKDIQEVLIVGLYTYKNNAYGVKDDALLEVAMEEYVGYVKDENAPRKAEYNMLNMMVNQMTAKLIGLYEKT